ncbi:MAG: hypothetical protein LQ350_000631 [Teloschistes chrysophthalmus]|nr:MAG: hypothetical protein LQ350_000631 [Niorma chrysophthalma]
MPPKKKPKLTHFLCLPIITQHSTPQWQKSLQQFTKDTILSPQPSPNSAASPNGNDEGSEPTLSIPSKAIRPLGALHLTIGVMSLTNGEKIHAATALLKSLNITKLLLDAEQPESDAEAEVDQNPGPSSSKPSPLLLSFTTLQSLHSPQSTSALYIPPTDTTGRLYPFCQALKARFTQEGLMVQETREMKLHATVLNMIYAGQAGKAWSNTKTSTAPENPPPNNDALTTDDPQQADAAGEEKDHHEKSGLAALAGDALAALTGDDKVQSGHEPHPSSKSKPKFKRKKHVMKFDARDLLSKYATFEWAKDVKVEKVIICEMGAKEIMDGEGNLLGEQYKELVTSVALP